MSEVFRSLVVHSAGDEGDDCQESYADDVRCTTTSSVSRPAVSRLSGYWLSKGPISYDVSRQGCISLSSFQQGVFRRFTGADQMLQLEKERGVFITLRVGESDEKLLARIDAVFRNLIGLQQFPELSTAAFISASGGARNIQLGNRWRWNGPVDWARISEASRLIKKVDRQGGVWVRFSIKPAETRGRGRDMEVGVPSDVQTEHDLITTTYNYPNGSPYAFDYDHKSKPHCDFDVCVVCDPERAKANHRHRVEQERYQRQAAERLKRERAKRTAAEKALKAKYAQRIAEGKRLEWTNLHDELNSFAYKLLRDVCVNSALTLQSQRPWRYWDCAIPELLELHRHRCGRFAYRKLDEFTALLVGFDIAQTHNTFHHTLFKQRSRICYAWLSRELTMRAKPPEAVKSWLPASWANLKSHGSIPCFVIPKEPTEEEKACPKQAEKPAETKSSKSSKSATATSSLASLRDSKPGSSPKKRPTKASTAKPRKRRKEAPTKGACELSKGRSGRRKAKA